MKVKDISKLIANKARMPYCWEEVMNRLAEGKALPFKLTDRHPNLENTTGALQCPECQQNGESGMNFCANCGRQLWHR